MFEISEQLKCISQKTEEHPCYSSNAHKNSRMHLPVAPACNIICNYCNRKYDCQNESRPGVTSEVLSPEEAARKFLVVKEQVANLKVIGIAGPGDALANFENTKKTIELIKEIDKDITFCISTNGLMLPVYVEELIDLGVFHVTITMNAIDPEIGSKIYKEVHFKDKKISGIEAAEILLANQLEGLQELVKRGAKVKVNIIMMKGINEHHIETIVKKVKELGAFMTNITPLIPVKGSYFEDMPLTSHKELMELRKKCELDLKQMYHCRQCRADAIGMLSEDLSSDFRMKGCSALSSNCQSQKNNSYLFAVASKTGMMVDEHFGRVNEFLIYQYLNSEIKFIESRVIEKYCKGVSECDSEEIKIHKLMNTIKDCDTVIVQRIGYGPAKLLESKGINVVETCGSIREAILEALSGELSNAL